MYRNRFESQDSFRSGGQLQIDEMELGEEWQDEEFPRPLPEDSEFPESSEEDHPNIDEDGKPVPPSTLDLCGNRHMKKRLLAPEISLNLEGGDKSGSIDYPDPTPDDDFDINIDELETPSDSETFEFSISTDFEWEDDLPRRKRSGSGASTTRIAAGRVRDEMDREGRKWRIFSMTEQDYRVDMTLIEPYKKVISHGGYFGEGVNALIIFASCYLPERNIPEYQNVMDNLFRYIIGTLDLLVAESYVLVYLNGCTPRSKIPSIGWVRHCYQTVDRRLRKNLKALLIVHPSWYIKALITIIRPFISAKFIRKVKFINSLWELSELIPMDHVKIPDCITKYDQEMNSTKKRKT
ncbi:bcl-2/adenovirus E1B 19 kDa-interacting protein 2-like protein isoform X2 [Protopterus annectens]|uniref:bcl-2/adenovirus E1B 19 kDa-interacting protein 2-like protein isoform X2 n=1 Tax=Protopterus annectens TaxID=7888 RepID=UPI001CFA128C|nr:bcl-2/adenovirus E1B 19 kDa-interacting protein 2-like protein isoform X2 [Protopterus annectens]